MPQPAKPPRYPPQLPHAPRGLVLSRGRRWSIYAVAALLLLTGGAWLIARFLPDVLPAASIDPGTQALWQSWSMKLHGAGALASLFLLGQVWTPHIRQGWRRHHNRWAGAVFGATVGLLVMTGYGLYYFNGEGVRDVTEWLHWIAGALAAFLFWLHLSRGRRAIARRQDGQRP